MKSSQITQLGRNFETVGRCGCLVVREDTAFELVEASHVDEDTVRVGACEWTGENGDVVDGPGRQEALKGLPPTSTPMRSMLQDR